VLGKTISHYRIIEKLGAGGQGEVYLAEDSRLDRKVALKILPQHLSERADLRERFEREARAVSSLNHPHICTLYDVGEQDGIHFLVMEYLEGQTLAARLEKGALPLEQTLQYAIQVADALDKAHRQGVVHRDLKPGNIMLTKSGAKLLDFGLAKLQAKETPTNLSALPTEQDNLTAEGTILGTLQYMAPEQLEGKEADSRTDIFAFGAVVYEMATGKKAFEGQSQASLIGAIMNSEPPPMSELQPMTPQLLDWVVKRCLEKEPDERVQTAADLMAELRWVAEARTQADLFPSVTPPPLWRRAIPWSIAVVAVLVASLAFWSLTRPTQLPLRKFMITPPSSAFLRNDGSNDLAISPDGKQFIYHAGSERGYQLYLRSLDNFVNMPIPGTEGVAGSVFFSPDGESVGFFKGSQLMKVSLRGGPVVTLCEVAIPRGRLGSWGPDDTIVFASGYAGDESGAALYRVSASGGEPEILATPDLGKGEDWYFAPHILPGGRVVLFTIGRGRGSSPYQIAALSLETGEQKILIEGGRQASYVETGHLIYEQSGRGNLMAVPFDLATLEVRGEPVQVLQEVRQNPEDYVDYAVSGNGTLVYVPLQTDVHRLVWVDRKGNESLITQEEGRFKTPRISPDGKQVAVVIEKGVEDQNLWIYGLESGSLRRLTFEGGSGETWSPDGKWIIFQTGTRISRQFADGSGPIEHLTVPTFSQLPGSLTPDGKVLAFTRNSIDIWVLPVDGNGDPRPLITSPNRECCPKFSPDGKWIVYVSDELGPDHVYVAPYPKPDVKWLVSTEEGGGEPIWSPDGTELFYRSGNRLMAVSVQTEPTFRAGRPEVLFEGSYVMSSDLPGYQYYDISPDGQRFLMIKAVEGSTGQINVILNWFEELKRLAPSN